MSRQLDGTGLKRLHRSWRQRASGRVGVVLDGVHGPFNVGSIVRTAAAYRVEHLWLTAACPPPRAASVQKTALGTDRYVPWSVVDRGADAVRAAHEAGYTVIAIELTDDARPLHEVVVGDAACVVLGNEDHGIAAATLAAVDTVAYLPQLGRVGSLNVATAAAIALYEIRRREWA